MTTTSAATATSLDPLRASTLASAPGSARKPATTADAAVATTPQDVVSLSTAAQATSASAFASSASPSDASDLTSAQAQSQAADLRSQLNLSQIGGQALSASAQQNQAILSLLR